MILAGDVGGTKARLGLFHVEAGVPVPRREQTYPSRDFPNLESIVRGFLADGDEKPQRACFGLAGPVQHGRCQTPNLPWIVDTPELKRALGIDSVRLINDLEANAYGIEILQPTDLIVLAAGEQGREGNRAVIAAGTGLGEAGIFWDGKVHRPFATEGGHTDFSPRNDQEDELLAFLRARFGHVSWERVLSGPGLLNLYTFLRDTGRGEEPEWLAKKLKDRDPPAVVSQLALEGKSALCVEALNWFISLYGAEAGNLALKLMATGGVYIGGGIAPKIISKLRGPAFMEAFTAKARMRGLLERISVHVIMNDRAALLGSAVYAWQHMD